MICKILKLFVNRFNAYDKYFVLNREYLTHPIHLQLCQKQETFAQFLSVFLKSGLNFEQFKKKKKKKNTRMANVFPKLGTSKKVVT